ncbi:hypothetical protein FLONG3_3241 [Fusarium longipes]|uniref:Uncharacterized protein n=1 Tax=Fusarium longipes TaxID=694270 RepID=A0A395T2K0_9HYPO|nr:hypothetical protein FLONG3_3241 [Fusarium longipes]
MSEVPATSETGQPVTTKNDLPENLKKPTATSKERAATNLKEKHSSEFKACHNELKAETVKPPLSKNDKNDCKMVQWSIDTQYQYETDLNANVKLHYFDGPDFNNAGEYWTGWLSDGWNCHHNCDLFIVEVWVVDASVPDWKRDKQKERYVPVENHWLRDGFIHFRYDRNGLHCWNDYITAEFKKVSD